jgi:hypothetical protein
MKKITLYCLAILVLVMAPISGSSQALTKDFEGVLQTDHVIGAITEIIKVGNEYILYDMRYQKVYVTNSSFNVTLVLDGETCHPGAPFNPTKITYIGDDKVLVSSNPIRAYIFDLKTKKCSTREFAEAKFIGHGDMTNAGNGILGLTYRKDEKTLIFYTYSATLRPETENSLKDDMPFANLRSRNASTNILLYHNNRALYLNPYDMSILYLDLKSTNNKVNRVIKPIPIPGLNKVNTDLSTTAARDLFDFTEKRNIENGKHIINRMWLIGDDRLLFQVPIIGEKIWEYSACDIELSSCSKIKFYSSDYLIYADQNELIFSRHINGGENILILRYTHN